MCQETRHSTDVESRLTFQLFCPRYNDLRRSLKRNVVESGDTLLRNFEQEFASVSSNKGTSGHSLHQKMDIVFHSDEESSLGDSSLNQVMLV